MKTAIIYASVHHGNTKKIIDEIARTSEVDLIGFASGVYYGKFHQSVLKFASVNLIENKNIFLMQLNVTLFKYTNEILGV